jgi:CBS domain-containing membrane protein
VGVSCRLWIPDPWAAAGLAVGLSLFAMHSLRCLHPPGGATTLVAVLGGESVDALGYRFLLMPLGLNLAVPLILARVLRRQAQAYGLAGLPSVTLCPDLPAARTAGYPHG